VGSSGDYPIGHGGCGFKDFGQVGRQLRNAISWREEGYNEETKAEIEEMCGI